MPLQIWSDGLTAGDEHLSASTWFSWDTGTGFCIQASSCSLETIHTGTVNDGVACSGDSHTVLLFLCPIQELVNHRDHVWIRVNTRIGHLLSNILIICFCKPDSYTHRKMHRMGIETDRLAVSRIVSGKCTLHVLQSRGVIDRALAVRSIPVCVQTSTY